MWHEQNGTTVFLGGKEDYDAAAACAARCEQFKADCEEEWAADEECSCYNCRYRRWTRESFVCMKGEQP